MIRTGRTVVQLWIWPRRFFSSKIFFRREQAEEAKYIRELESSHLNKFKSPIRDVPKLGNQEGKL